MKKLITLLAILGMFAVEVSAQAPYFNRFRLSTAIVLPHDSLIQDSAIASAAITVDMAIADGAIGNDTASVALPGAAAGARVYVANNTDSVLAVFPASADSIGTTALNTAVYIAARKASIFLGVSGSAWIRMDED